MNPFARGWLSLTVLLAVWPTTALADRAAAPLPLYATPDLSGAPVLTLPAGKALVALGEYRQYTRPAVVAVPYGQQVYYARSGLISSEGQGIAVVSPVGGAYTTTPQPAGQPIRLLVGGGEAGRSLGRLELRVLPLGRWDTAEGVSRYQATGGVLHRIPVVPRPSSIDGLAPIQLPALPPGAYLVTASQAGATTDVQGAEVLIVTSLNLMATVLPNAVQVYAMHAVTGQPLPGTRVKASAWRRIDDPTSWRWEKVRDLPAVTTDAQGRATFPVRDGEALQLNAEVQIAGQSHRADLDLSSWGVGVSERARAFLQTSKPVYRPGETLEGLAVVRRLVNGERQPYSGPVTVRLTRGWGGNELYSVSAQADAQGLVRFEMPLASEIRTGDYEVEVEVPTPPTAENPQPDPSVSRLPVRVQAFVKPQFTLDAQAPTQLIAGEPLPLNLSADLYAGGPAQVQAEIFLDLMGQQSNLNPQGQDDPLAELRQETQSAAWWSGSDYSYLDRKPALTRSVDGRASFSLPTSALKNAPQAARIIVRAKDEYGRDVYAEHWLTLHPAGIRLVLQDWAEQVGDRVAAAVQVRSVTGDQPQAGRRVQAQLIRTFYVEGQQRTEVAAEQTLTSDAAGWVRPSFALPRDGSYTIKLSAQDASGRQVTGELWAGQRGAAYVYAPPQRYQAELVAQPLPRHPGEQVRAELKTNLPAGTPLLLEIAAEDRLIRQPLTVRGPVTPIAVPLDAASTPGVRLDVTTTYQGEVVRASTAVLPVVRDDRRVEIRVTGPSGKLRPGERVTLDVETVQSGQPQPALVTLNAVQEALYAVAEDPAPDPWRLFWGVTSPQAWQVTSYDLPPDGRGGGGAGGDGAPLRSDLRELALFDTVQTGADGRAQVTFTLPEALGEYRVSARAFSGQTAVGQTRSELTVGLPYAVRLSRPRVLTAGDRGMAYLSVQDEAGSDRTEQVTLEVGGAAQTQPLTLRAGRGTVRFDLSAPEQPGPLTLVARAGGAQGDALQETLPVRPAGSREVSRASGLGPHRETLSVPAGQQPEALVLTLAAGPHQARIASLSAYLRDPAERWITTDGVAASLGANLDLLRLSQALSWESLLPAQELRAAAQRDVQALLSLHLDYTELGGGWGWTAQSTVPDAEQTGLALAALGQARAAGLVTESVLDSAREDAQKLLTQLKGPPDSTLVAALIQAGDAQGMAALGRLQNLSAAQQARLAAALAPAQPGAARPLYRSALADAQQNAAESRSGSWALDTAEGTAWLALAAQRLGQMEEAQMLLEAVWQARTGQSFGGPRDTAAAVAALTLAAQQEAAGSAGGSAAVRLGGETQPVSLAQPQRLVFGPQQLTGAPELTLSGPAGLAWEREFLTRRVTAPPAALSSVRLERSYSATRVGRDEIVTVTLRVQAPTALKGLRLTDPTPGGLEAVDDRPFAFPGWENTPGSTALAWAERSIYDDRSVFYLEQLPAGETVIRYQLRALASGDYQAPAPYLEASQGGQLGEGRAERLWVE